MKKNFRRVRPAAQMLYLFGLTTALAFGQAGDIDLSSVNTLGSTLLKAFLGVAVIAFVALLIWGALTLTTNRPRGLAMIGGGLVGALLAGISFAIVSRLTGQAVVPGMLLFQAVR